MPTIKPIKPTPIGTMSTVKTPSMNQRLKSTTARSTTIKPLKVKTTQPSPGAMRYQAQQTVRAPTINAVKRPKKM